MKDPEFLARYNIRVNVPLADQTKIQAGGKTDFFAEVGHPEELANLLIDAGENDLAVTVIGCGSRIVCGEHGYRGLVVRYQARGYDLGNGEVTVDAGYPVHGLIGKLAKVQRGGLEPFAGYAGSVGGAIAAGANRGTLKFADRIKEVTLWSGGRTITVTAADLKYGDQGSSRLGSGNEWVLTAKLSVLARQPEESTRLIAEATRARLKGEPAGKPFVFIFRDPPGESADELLRQVQVGGERQGGAVVSEKNPNAIINAGGASAQDVYNLAQRMKARVKMQLGRKLTESVTWLGER